MTTKVQHIVLNYYHITVLQWKHSFLRGVSKVKVHRLAMNALSKCASQISVFNQSNLWLLN